MNLIPTQYKLAAYGIALAVIVAGFSAWHLHGLHLAREEGRQEVQAKWDKERAQQAQDLLAHNAAVRAEEQRRAIAEGQINEDNQKRIEASNSAVSSINAQLERMRKLANQASPANQRHPPDQPTTFVCTADQETRELLRSCANRLIERYARYSEVASAGADSTTRGIACQNWYDTLTPSRAASMPTP